MPLVGMLRQAIVRDGFAGLGDERLDRVGEMLAADVVVTMLNPEPVGPSSTSACVWPTGGSKRYDASSMRQPQRILEVNRVHEAAVFDAAVWIPRSSSRSTACQNVACESENATWCTQPMSVDVRVGSGSRSSFVKVVMRRPSPGSKYRWLSDSLSRLGCSKTNGIPSKPSQKSIDVWRSAPTIVMWWTPWLRRCEATTGW